MTNLQLNFPQGWFKVELKETINQKKYFKQGTNTFYFLSNSHVLQLGINRTDLNRESGYLTSNVNSAMWILFVCVFIYCNYRL